MEIIQPRPYKEELKKIRRQTIFLAILAAVIISIVIKGVFAWTNPTQAPPGGSGILPAQFVTSLPGSPVEGQEIIYEASASNKIYWHLKYKSSIGKWLKIGGPPLTGFSSGDFALSQTLWSWAVDTARSPAVTVPLTGQYRIEFAARGHDQAASIPHYFVISPATAVSGGTLNAGTIEAWGYFEDPSQTVAYTTVASEGKATLNANNTIRLYRYFGGGSEINVDLTEGVISLDPVYVQ